MLERWERLLEQHIRTNSELMTREPAGQLAHPKAGTPWYNDASSAIGAPTLSLPILTSEGLPLGVQIMGFEYEDAELVSIARWIMSLFAPQLV